MSLPVIVDIAIGLAFIYLMLSLLASEIQELIATILQWRAKHLQDSIVNLFASDVNSTHSVEKANKLAKNVYRHPLIRGLNQESKGFLPNLFRGMTWLMSRLYQRITGRPEGEFGDRRTAPSYIPPESFATALLEQLGTKYFIERLVEAKFSEFIELTLAEMSSDKEIKSQEGFQELEKNLHRIEGDFIEDRIDLESSIASIRVKLDEFLKSIESDKASELRDWKERVFVDDERVIKNAGLKPTLQEIVDSIDKDSKTYRTYKERFARYEQERAQEVGKDLHAFEEFLSAFLNQLLTEQKVFDYKFDIIVFENPPANWTEHEIDASNPIRRTKTPMHRIEEVIITHLLEAERRNAGSEKRRSIRAFREGFSGKSNLSNWRDFNSSGEYVLSRIVPFALLFLFGFLVSVTLSDLQLSWLGQARAFFRNLLLSKWSGFFSILCLVGLPLVWFTGSRSYFAHHRWKSSAGVSDRKSSDRFLEPSNQTLTEIFDNYSVDELSESIDATPVDADVEGPQTATLLADGLTKNNSTIIREQRFSHDIASRLKALERAPAALRYNEIKDLGRSFRRYYLKLALENADIDLPFIPSSIKQSLAVLIRRSKINARQTEDQILQLKSEVEDWYDRSMERASGVYRRNAKGISILIGIALAIAVNANSIHILDQLAFNDALRETIAGSVQQSMAERSMDDLTDSEREALLADLEQSLDDINLPIGWDPALINEEFGCQTPNTSAAVDLTRWNQLIQACVYNQSSADNSLERPEAFFYPTAILSIFLQEPLLGLKYLLGWLITGIAISMGASFWFDLLSKLVKVRNTGGKPHPSVSGATGQKRDAADIAVERRRQN